MSRLKYSPCNDPVLGGHALRPVGRPNGQNQRPRAGSRRQEGRAEEDRGCPSKVE